MRESYEGGNCDHCEILMCDECIQRNDSKCHVCQEKLDRDEDPDGYFTSCDDCMEHCRGCNVSYHRECKDEHLETCNSRGRAERAVHEANKLVDEKNGS